MTDREPLKSRFTELREVQQDDYRAVSGFDVAGLVLGLLSVVALVDSRAVFISAIGVLVSGLALWRIARRSPELIGRKAAFLGLVLSLAIGTGIVAHTVAYRWLLVRQSREVAMAWFDRMAQGQPQIAYQLHLPPKERPPAGSDPWRYFCSDQKNYQALTQYVAEPGRRALLALGKNVVIRPYATEDVDQRDHERVVVDLFSATFEQEDRKTTFLVRVVSRRLADDATGRAVWQILNVEVGAQPSWEKDKSYLTDK